MKVCLDIDETLKVPGLLLISFLSCWFSNFWWWIFSHFISIFMKQKILCNNKYLVIVDLERPGLEFRPWHNQLCDPRQLVILPLGLNFCNCWQRNSNNHISYYEEYIKWDFLNVNNSICYLKRVIIQYAEPTKISISFNISTSFYKHVIIF